MLYFGLDTRYGIVSTEHNRKKCNSVIDLKSTLKVISATGNLHCQTSTAGFFCHGLPKGITNCNMCAKAQWCLVVCSIAEL